jgi:hypothetical protein
VDATILLLTLLLVGATWLLFKLAVGLEQRK